MTGTILELPTRARPGRIRRPDGSVLNWPADPRAARGLDVIRGDRVTFDVADAGGQFEAVDVRVIPLVGLVTPRREIEPEPIVVAAPESNGAKRSAALPPLPDVEITGRLDTWNASNGYGFVVTDTAGRVFLHRARIVGSAEPQLGDVFAFFLVRDGAGRVCANRARITRSPVAEAAPQRGVITGWACAGLRIRAPG